jgi:hypothetical protein
MSSGINVLSPCHHRAVNKPSGARLSETRAIPSQLVGQEHPQSATAKKAILSIANAKIEVPSLQL